MIFDAFSPLRHSILTNPLFKSRGGGIRYKLSLRVRYISCINFVCNEKATRLPSRRNGEHRWRIAPQKYVSMPPEAPRDSQDPHGNLGDKRAIPKFASFRPKATPKYSSHEERASKAFNSHLSDQSDSAEKSVVKRPQHTHASDRDRSPGSHGQGERKDRTRSEKPDVTFKHSKDITEPFVVDRLGDPRNLTFGALDRYSAPAYFRVGAGTVVGTSVGQTIDRNVSSEKGLVLSHCASSKKAGRRSLWRVDDYGSRELKIKPQANQRLGVDVAVDFIPLTTVHRKKRKRGGGGSGSGYPSSSGEEHTHYRSIEGKAKPEDRPVDPDLIYGSDAFPSDDQEEGRSSTLDETVQERRIELSKKLEAEPANCDAWMSLINNQDKVFGLSKTSKRTALTDAEKGSSADVKLSMYEKALEKMTHLQDREILLLGMMDEATKVWENQKLSSRWKSVLESNPGSLRLWTRFLDFKQSSLSSFRYEEVRNLYLECLSILERATGAKNASGKRVSEQEETFEIQVYVLLRMTLFMRESGFSEHAIAAWQAVLEYEFRRPDHIQGSKHNHDNSSRQKAISSFEEFWDSEVPRVGENGSGGWRRFYAQQGQPPDPKTEMAGSLEDGPNLWTSWLGLEREHGLLARDPARTIDDVEENDPYRVILFSDIRPFLIDPPTISSRSVLLDAFILFCHLPPRSEEESDAHAKIKRRDGFLRNEALNLSGTMSGHWDLRCHVQSEQLLDFVGSQEDIPDRTSTKANLFSFHTADYQVSSDCLFSSTGSWFSAFDAWQNLYVGDLGPLRAAFVLQVLKALVMLGVGGDGLAEYSLALELSISPETVKKAARALLKKQPSNLRLYNAYALIEYRLGNPSKGENILITSINMSKKLEELVQQDSILLWRTWIWELLSAGKTREALERLLAYGDKQFLVALPNMDQSENQALTPALLLRTESALMSTRDHLLSLRKYTHACLAMECLTMFTYLRNSLSLSAATLTFKSNLALLSQPTQSTNHEYLHQSFARLLYHHSTHMHLFKPSDIRSLLAESIAEFPHNAIFLSLYSWNEARFRIDDRVRSIVRDVILANEDFRDKQQGSVIPHFFAIYTELHRSVTFGSNTSTIRSTFERAVDSASGMHCAGLWKLYFLFEKSRGEIAGAKAVFWRGVRACPWAKALYLLAFEHLRGVLGDADLRGIYELLGERELRVHVGLEDIFEEMDERKRTR